jgi:hypothetical protein
LRPRRSRHTYEYKNTFYAVRDLDLWGQPSSLIFQPCSHRCPRCGHRQEHFAPFKRKKVMYTLNYIAELREITSGPKAVFLAFCT